MQAELSRRTSIIAERCDSYPTAHRRDPFGNVFQIAPSLVSSWPATAAEEGW